MCESESLSVISDSLGPYGSYSQWNYPGQNNGMGSRSLLQGIFPTQGPNSDLLISGGLFSSWATREAHLTIYNDMYLPYSIIQASFTGLNFPYCPHIQPFLPYNPWQSLIFLLSLWFYFFQNVILLESTVCSLFIVVSFTYWHAFKVLLCLLTPW